MKLQIKYTKNDFFKPNIIWISLAQSKLTLYVGARMIEKFQDEDWLSQGYLLFC